MCHTAMMKHSTFLFTSQVLGSPQCPVGDDKAWPDPPRPVGSDLSSRAPGPAAPTLLTDPHCSLTSLG